MVQYGSMVMITLQIELRWAGGMPTIFLGGGLTSRLRQSSSTSPISPYFSGVRLLERMLQNILEHTLQKSKHALQKSTVISYNSAKTSLGIMSQDSQNKVFCGGRSAHFRILRWESTMNEYSPLKLVLHLIIHHITSHQVSS